MDENLARKKAKCVEAINGIILLMRKNGIPLPLKYQKSRVHEDLPKSDSEREGISLMDCFCAEFCSSITFSGNFEKIPIS